MKEELSNLDELVEGQIAAIEQLEGISPEEKEKFSFAMRDIFDQGRITNSLMQETKKLSREELDQAKKSYNTEFSRALRENNNLAKTPEGRREMEEYLKNSPMSDSFKKEAAKLVDDQAKRSTSMIFKIMENLQGDNNGKRSAAEDEMTQKLKETMTEHTANALVESAYVAGRRLNIPAEQVLEEMSKNNANQGKVADAHATAVEKVLKEGFDRHIDTLGKIGSAGMK